MNSVAVLRAEDRRELFEQTAARLGFNAVNVEKDFWVCWLLKQLFSLDDLNGWLVFKGGTSLSKCYNLIRRFSEDIDLAVNFERLGYTGDKDPRRSDLSHTKRGVLLSEMTTTCQQYIAGPFVDALDRRIRDILGLDGWSLRVSADDASAVEFAYPGALSTRLDYIAPHVTLELGTHAEPIPHEDRPVTPYVAEHFPELFQDTSHGVTTVVARRTFWEKATILHAEYYRPLDKPMLARYSRHWADVAAMAATPVKGKALADLGLLQGVCIHKDRFYHSGWARYLDAKPGSIRLAPRKERLPELRRDYQAMQVMFFEQPPSFDGIVAQLADLERDINSIG